MSRRYDVVVIGAGHNGLTTAILLAKRGLQVLVLEKNKVPGGLAASYEFCPGFYTPGLLHDTSRLRPLVVKKLELAKFGLQLQPEDDPIFAPQRQGRGLLLFREFRRAEAEIAAHSASDAKAYAGYRATLDGFGVFLRQLLDNPPADFKNITPKSAWDLLTKTVALRKLGKAKMTELLRIVPMCVGDWLGEWFESDLLKACLAAPAIHHSYTGPRSPGSNCNLLLDDCLVSQPVIGGPQALAKALVAAAGAAGVEIRTAAEVVSIVMASPEQVAGISLADGSVVNARYVAASCDPRQLFLRLVPPAYLPQGLEHGISHLRLRGTTAKVHLAVNKYPVWQSRPELQVANIRIGESLEAMERAFDAVKYRQVSSNPLLEINVPTLAAPELAPSGQHVLSILVHFAPYDHDGSWTDMASAQLYQKTLQVLEQYAPGIGSSVVGREVLTPVDLEQRFNLTGGHLYHGEHALDQLLLRPTPECASYRTPFKGLYLCGSGAFPGGGLTGAPGAFAARAMLQDL